MVVTPIRPIKPIHSVKELLPHYDAFIIDLWGVIHDGRERYPGVLEALALLRESGKKVIFLSNAPRRSAKAKVVLDKLGVTEDYYDLLYTSGEAVFRWINQMPYMRESTYKIIGPDRDDDLLSECDLYIQVQYMENANFAVVTGFNDDSSDPNEKLPQLEAALKRNIPLICANPDHVVVRLDGTEALCAGVIAEQYEKMGGKVIYYGKPYIEVYLECLTYLMKFDISKRSRVAVIGDNLDTDIKGGNNTKMDTYLIAGGILGGELGVTHGELPDINRLTDYCNSKLILPKGVMPGLLA